MRVFLTAAVCLALGLGGCVPVLVAGLFYKSTKTADEKAAFTTDFQKNNTEREKAHLPPLDWCSAAYKFDKGWAAEDPVCAARIKQYESGDQTALSG